MVVWACACLCMCVQCVCVCVRMRACVCVQYVYACVRACVRGVRYVYIFGLCLYTAEYVLLLTLMSIVSIFSNINIFSFDI